MSKLFKSDDDDFGYLDDSIHINWKKLLPAIIIIAAIATPIAKSQHMREIWFYVMSGGVMLKIVVMEIARIIQMF